MEYKNVYIAVCDILGFKDMINNNNFETTKKIFKKFVISLELSVTGGKAIQYDFQDRPRITADPSEIKLNFNLFSDTVVLWTLDTSFKSFFDLIIGTANLFNSSMKAGIPLRGAISQGELLVNPYQVQSEFSNFENVILGKAHVKAYQLEQDQLWSGCIIDPEFAHSEESAIRSIFENGLNRDLYIFYHVPLKSKGCRRNLTINWVDWKENSEIIEDSIVQSFQAYNKSISDKSVEKKLENTLAYYFYSREIMKQMRSSD